MPHRQQLLAEGTAGVFFFGGNEMIFWVFVFLAIAMLAGSGFLIYLQTNSRPADDWALGLIGTVPGFIICCVVVSVVWTSHASDVSKVVAQHHRIDVYEERITSLEQRLNQANYPEKSVVSLDADTPWATMMQELAKAETKLAEAKDEWAIAIRSIEARKRGPMSGVVWFVGDVPEGAVK